MNAGAPVRLSDSSDKNQSSRHSPCAVHLELWQKLDCESSQKLSSSRIKPRLGSFDQRYRSYGMGAKILGSSDSLLPKHCWAFVQGAIDALTHLYPFKRSKSQACPSRKRRGWFPITPFATGSGNGAGRLSNLTQCLTCSDAYAYFEKHRVLPDGITHRTQRCIAAAAGADKCRRYHGAKLSIAANTRHILSTLT